MGIDADTPITDLRKTISDFVQEHVVVEGNVVIGTMLIFECIGEQGERRLAKYTTSADAASPLPEWTQVGYLHEAGDFEYWAEWLDPDEVDSD